MAAKPDRHDLLIAELETHAVSDVFGVFGASTMAGASSGHEAFPWVLQFTLASWKYFGGELQNRELTVRKLVSEQELLSMMGGFEPYDVIHIRARVAEQNSYGRPQALLDEIIGKHPFDAELKRRALELQQPVTLTNERFGVFTLDRSVDGYEASVPWGDVRVRLALSASEGGDTERCLATANAIWDLQSAWQERITNCVVTEMLRLKNDSWLGEGESELNKREFKDRLILDSIDVQADGSFEFWFDDGDMFLGHSIRVSGSLAKGPTFVGLEG